MKKFCLFILALALTLSMVACGESTDTTIAPTTVAPTTTVPATTAPQTYDVVISHENYEGMVMDWLITGVYAESTFLSEGMELRVLYVLSGSSMKTLREFWVDDYPYTGAYHDNGDGTFSYDSDRLEAHGQWETYEIDGERLWKAGGGYPSLPDGSWFFGDVGYSHSFFVVVGDAEAAANGTVPSM